MKSGAQVLREIYTAVNSGDCSNDMVMEQVRRILDDNKHITALAPVVRK